MKVKIKPSSPIFKELSEEDQNVRFTIIDEVLENGVYTYMISGLGEEGVLLMEVFPEDIIVDIEEIDFVQDVLYKAKQQGEELYKQLYG